MHKSLLLATLLTLTPLAFAAPGDDEMMMSDKPAATKPAAATRSTTRPTLPQGRPAQILERIRQNAEQLKLSDDQKQQLQQIADSARGRLTRSADDQARQELFRDTLEKVRSVLNSDQQRKLREVLQNDGAPMRGGRGEMERGSRVSEGQKPVESAKKESPISSEPVDPGTLELQKLDGKTLTLSALKGKPVVLIFGSHSSPTFRDHAKDLDTLARQLSLKAHFYLIYTREAHPDGGWEVQRNKDAELTFKPHKDAESRVAAAKQLRSKLGLTIPMAVDTMDDQAVRAFDTFPSGCVILDRNGTLAARQKWADPSRIRSLLERITDVKPASKRVE